jgi:hypothetical protein
MDEDGLVTPVLHINESSFTNLAGNPCGNRGWASTLAGPHSVDNTLITVTLFFRVYFYLTIQPLTAVYILGRWTTVIAF